MAIRDVGGNPECSRPRHGQKSEIDFLGLLLRISCQALTLAYAAVFQIGLPERNVRTGSPQSRYSDTAVPHRIEGIPRMRAQAQVGASPSYGSRFGAGAGVGRSTETGSVGTGSVGVGDSTGTGGVGDSGVGGVGGSSGVGCVGIGAGGSPGIESAGICGAGDCPATGGVGIGVGSWPGRAGLGEAGDSAGIGSASVCGGASSCTCSTDSPRTCGGDSTRIGLRLSVVTTEGGFTAARHAAGLRRADAAGGVARRSSSLRDSTA